MGLLRDDRRIGIVFLSKTRKNGSFECNRGIAGGNRECALQLRACDRVFDCVLGQEASAVQRERFRNLRNANGYVAFTKLSVR